MSRNMIRFALFLILFSVGIALFYVYKSKQNKTELINPVQTRPVHIVSQIEQTKDGRKRISSDFYKFAVTIPSDFDYSDNSTVNADAITIFHPDEKYYVNIAIVETLPSGISLLEIVEQVKEENSSRKNISKISEEEFILDGKSGIRLTFSFFDEYVSKNVIKYSHILQLNKYKYFRIDLLNYKSSVKMDSEAISIFNTIEFDE